MKSKMLRGYPDLHDHLANLEKEGLLIRVKKPINKDTELHPLVRWQFRGGIPEPERKAFLFENVVDSKGRKYDMPVVVGAIGASRKIYSLGIGCALEEIRQRWDHAKAHPIEPVEIESAEAPVHEMVYTGEELRQGHGVDCLPVPISSPGWDNAPYVSAPSYITKDPETGIQNVGMYRAHIKSPTRVGMNPSVELRQGIYRHWLKYKERCQPMPAALLIGGIPCVTYLSIQKLPLDVDELTVAGGLVGAPIRVVKAKTVDLLVPADSEIIVEGLISTELLEPEAPFGESHGYVNPKEYNAYMDVTAITMRRNPILLSILSQLTPSESSLLKRVAWESQYKEHLHNTLGIKSVVDVVLHEPLTGLQKVTVIQMKNATQVEVWRALMAVVSFWPAMSKMAVAVDEDIDPNNPDAVFWAIGYRSRPHEDVQIVRGTDIGHAPRHDPRGTAGDSALLINATLRGTFPPVALPKREFMERAKEIWEELGLPTLKPESPWFGYSLGDWNEELDQEADLAVKSEYFTTGNKIEKQRRSPDEIPMNTSFYEQAE